MRLFFVSVACAIVLVAFCGVYFLEAQGPDRVAPPSGKCLTSVNGLTVLYVGDVATYTAVPGNGKDFLAVRWIISSDAGVRFGAVDGQPALPVGMQYGTATAVSAGTRLTVSATCSDGSRNRLSNVLTIVVHEPPEVLEQDIACVPTANCGVCLAPNVCGAFGEIPPGQPNAGDPALFCCPPAAPDPTPTPEPTPTRINPAMPPMEVRCIGTLTGPTEIVLGNTAQTRFVLDGQREGDLSWAVTGGLEILASNNVGATLRGQTVDASATVSVTFTCPGFVAATAALTVPVVSQPSPTATPLPTATPRPTNTPVPVVNPPVPPGQPTNTPLPTNTPVPLATPIPGPTPTLVPIIIDPGDDCDVPVRGLEAVRQGTDIVLTWDRVTAAEARWVTIFWQRRIPPMPWAEMPDNGGTSPDVSILATINPAGSVARFVHTQTLWNAAYRYRASVSCTNGMRGSRSGFVTVGPLFMNPTPTPVNPIVPTSTPVPPAPTPTPTPTPLPPATPTPPPTHTPAPPEEPTPTPTPTPLPTPCLGSVSANPVSVFNGQTSALLLTVSGGIPSMEGWAATIGTIPMQSALTATYRAPDSGMGTARVWVQYFCNGQWYAAYVDISYVVMDPTHTPTPFPTNTPVVAPPPTVTPVNTPVIIPTNTPVPAPTNTPAPTASCDGYLDEHPPSHFPMEGNAPYRQLWVAEIASDGLPDFSKGYAVYVTAGELSQTQEAVWTSSSNVENLAVGKQQERGRVPRQGVATFSEEFYGTATGEGWVQVRIFCETGSFISRFPLSVRTLPIPRTPTPIPPDPTPIPSCEGRIQGPLELTVGDDATYFLIMESGVSMMVQWTLSPRLSNTGLGRNLIFVTADGLNDHAFVRANITCEAGNTGMAELPVVIKDVRCFPPANLSLRLHSPTSLGASWRWHPAQPNELPRIRALANWQQFVGDDLVFHKLRYDLRPWASGLREPLKVGTDGQRIDVRGVCCDGTVRNVRGRMTCVGAEVQSERASVTLGEAMPFVPTPAPTSTMIPLPTPTPDPWIVTRTVNIGAGSSETIDLDTEWKIFYFNQSGFPPPRTFLYIGGGDYRDLFSVGTSYEIEVVGFSPIAQVMTLDAMIYQMTGTKNVTRLGFHNVNPFTLGDNDALTDHSVMRIRVME